MERNFISSCPEPRAWHTWTGTQVLILESMKPWHYTAPQTPQSACRGHPIPHKWPYFPLVLQLHKEGILLSCFSTFSFLSSPEEHASSPRNGPAVVRLLDLALPSLHFQASVLLQSSVAPTAAKSRTWWGHREATLRRCGQGPGAAGSPTVGSPCPPGMWFLWALTRTTTCDFLTGGPHLSAPCLCVLFLFQMSEKLVLLVLLFQIFLLPQNMAQFCYWAQNGWDCRSYACIFTSAECPRNVFRTVNKWSITSWINKFHRSNHGFLSHPK